MTKCWMASVHRGCTSSRLSDSGYQRLYSTLARLSEQLKASAHALNTQRLTANERLHWQTRGRQQLLGAVAHHLQELCVKHHTSRDLFLALQDYYGCLEKYEIDVQEEQHAPAAKSGGQVNRWKAEGAAEELPTVFADITHALHTYSSLLKPHIENELWFSCW